MTRQRKKSYLRSITGHHRRIFGVREQQILIACSSTVCFSPDQGVEHVHSLSPWHRRNFLHRLAFMSREKLTWVFSVLPAIRFEGDQWNLCSNFGVKYRQKISLKINTKPQFTSHVKTQVLEWTWQNKCRYVRNVHYEQFFARWRFFKHRYILYASSDRCKSRSK